MCKTHIKTLLSYHLIDADINTQLQSSEFFFSVQIDDNGHATT